MNTDKTMIQIIRGAGVLTLLLAAKGVYDAALYLWQHRQDLHDVGGIGKQAAYVGMLTLVGVLLWTFSKRLGPWLCSGPGPRRRPAPKTPEHWPAEEDTEA